MRREHGAAALIFIASSIAFTWPLVLNLERAVADPGDPYIVIWILDWNWWATFTDPGSLFHANIFHPARYALAFSEHLFGIAALLFPLRALGVSAITAYNVALLVGFAFSGFGAYLLGRHLTGSWIAGMAAGVFYAFLPFRFVHLSHLQHIWGGWLPLLLLAVLLYAAEPSRRRAGWFAAAFVMNGLTNVHYLFFGAFTSAVTALLLVPRRQWRNLIFGALGALVVLGPFLYPYAAAARLYDLERTWEEVHRFSALPIDWLRDPEEPERRLYPGAPALVLALIGTVAAGPLARRAFPHTAGRVRATLGLSVLWVAIGFLGSLGVNFEFHRFLFGAVPGFRAIRAPSRWAVIAYIGMAVLIALAVAAAARRKRWAAGVVALILPATLWSAPTRWYLADPQPPPVYRWLAGQNVTAVAEVPIDLPGIEYEYMLMATWHRKRIVNGISGFSPPYRQELSALWNQDPIPDAFLEMLADSGVGLVIVHADALGDRADVARAWLAREIDRRRLGFVGRFDRRADHDWVFSIGPAPNDQRPDELQAFLEGRPVCGSSISGMVDFPPPGFHFGGGNAIFSGWATSPHGIASVDLWFNNRTVRRRAELIADPGLGSRCPGLPRSGYTRFVSIFEDRPPRIWEENDVQVEVTDGRGAKRLFDDRWFRWGRAAGASRVR